MRSRALRRAGATAIALSFPVIMLSAAVRAVMSRTFLAFEYTRPGFPGDTFGFSTDDRLLYGSYGVDYLSNAAGPAYLGGLRFPDGRLLFKASEVTHMEDVKKVISTGLDVGLGLLVLAVVVAFFLRSDPRHLRLGLRWGALLTLAGIAVMGLAAAVDWEKFFAWVHSLFFASGTWTFYTDDTLIRLYPEQFWMDSALLIAAVVLGGCILALVASRGAGRRSLRS